MTWEHGGRRSPDGLRRPEHGWMEHGLCRDVEGTPKERVDMFFERARHGNDRARLLCARCPVRTVCADYAWDNGIEYGTYGGVTEHERRSGIRYMTDPVAPKADRSPLARLALELHYSGMNWQAINRETGLHGRTLYKLIQQDRAGKS